LKMDKIIVAVGSLRQSKIGAVHDALGAIRLRLGVGADFEVVGLDAASGVRHTPLSREETMSGARNRAEKVRQTARDDGKPWHFFVGLEGGIEVVRENGLQWTFLQNWAYVSDITGRGSFGQSGAILLPESLAKSVVVDGVDLADAVDTYAGLIGVRDAQGAWGVLTHGLITRRESYRIALINAFAGFLSR
jgi:non-canonical (house-cleaning) NTP pyrophosphatase